MHFIKEELRPDLSRIRNSVEHLDLTDLTGFQNAFKAIIVKTGRANLGMETEGGIMTNKFDTLSEKINTMVQNKDFSMVPGVKNEFLALVDWLLEQRSEE